MTIRLNEEAPVGVKSVTAYLVCAGTVSTANHDDSHEEWRVCAYASADRAKEVCAKLIELAQDVAQLRMTKRDRPWASEIEAGERVTKALAEEVAQLTGKPEYTQKDWLPERHWVEQIEVLP